MTSKMPSKKINDYFYKSRVLSKEMTHPLIEDEYEDECYELAYNMLPVTRNIFELQYGSCNKTDIVRMFMKNIFIYNTFKTWNESEQVAIKNIEEMQERMNMMERLAMHFDLSEFEATHAY